MKLWFERGAWASNKARQKIAALKPQEIKSIAVVRHAALGDMVLLRAFIVELRRHFPAASITLSLVSNYTYGAPRDMVDRVHTVYGSDQRSVSRREQIKRMKELGYHDLLFDLAATSRSFWLCLLNPAGFKIGFPYRAMQRHLIYDAAVLRSDFRFEADTMLDMLHLLGCATRYPPDFSLTEEPLQREKPCIVYFPSASTAEKCWPADHFSRLLGELAVMYPQHEHLVLEGVAEWESIEEIIAPHRNKPNVSEMKATDLHSTISLLKGADLLICNDTGIRNLAIAANTPTVGIFFCTIPYRYWPRYGRHAAVFEYDGSIPPVQKVLASVKAILHREDE